MYVQMHYSCEYWDIFSLFVFSTFDINKHVNHNDVVSGTRVHMHGGSNGLLNCTETSVQLILERPNVRWNYNSGNPGIGNFPAKASTSFWISLIFT